MIGANPTFLIISGICLAFVIMVIICFIVAIIAFKNQNK